MYESPITIVTQQSHNTISKQFDDYILTTVKAELGCEDNKEELIKALAYDRNQYDKGFRDWILRNGIHVFAHYES